MNGYAVVSSVRLRGPVYPTVSLRGYASLDWVAPALFMGQRQLFTSAVVNRPSEKNN